MARSSTLLHTWRRHCAWLMLAALVWACLAPQLARLSQPSSGPQAAWGEVCTGMGVMRVPLVSLAAATSGEVAVDGGVADPDAGQAVRPGDCPFCRLHALAALPVQAPRLGLAVPCRAAQPVPRPCEPAPGPAWRIDLARAPPPAIQA